MTALAYATITGDLGKMVTAATGSPPSTIDLTGAVVVTCNAQVPDYAASLAISGVGIRAVGPDTIPVAAGGVLNFEVIATGQDGVTIPSNFNYTIDFRNVTDANGHRVRLPPLTFTAPAGTTVDLSTVAPDLPVSSGTITPVGADQIQQMITASVTTAVNGLIAGAPGALNTLKELADALGDDANFAATVTAAIAAKPSIDDSSTANNRVLSAQKVTQLLGTLAPLQTVAAAVTS